MSYMWGITTERPTRAEARRRREAAKAEGAAYIEANVEPLPLDNRAVTTASEVYAKLRKAGSLVEDPDLLIASVCIANALPIVTGNVKHFERFREHGLSIRRLDDYLAPVRGS